MFKKKYYLGGQSKFLPKQELHFLMVPHEGTLRSAFKWWALKKNKFCRSFCPACKYYYRCQEDVAVEMHFCINFPEARKYMYSIGDGHKIRRK